MAAGVGAGREQRARRLVDAEIGRLGRQDHRHQEGERVRIGEFGARRRV